MKSRMATVAVFRGTDLPFEFREVPCPEPAPGEVLVAITRSTIYGSDLQGAAVSVFWSLSTTRKKTI